MAGRQRPNRHLRHCPHPGPGPTRRGIGGRGLSRFCRLPKRSWRRAISSWRWTGKPVNDAAGLNYRIGSHMAGDRVSLDYQRKGMVHTTHAVGRGPPANPPRDEQVLTGQEPFQGATVVNLSPAVALDLGGDPFAKGVLITAIKGGVGGPVLSAGRHHSPGQRTADPRRVRAQGGVGGHASLERGDRAARPKDRGEFQSLSRADIW